MGLEEEDHKGEVLFPSHHFKGTCCQFGLSLMTLTTVSWLRLPIVNTLFSPFPHWTLWKSRPFSRGRELNVHHLHKLFGILYGWFLSFPHLFFSSVIYWYQCGTHGYLFDTLDCSPIVHSLFVAQIAPAMGIGSFFRLVLMSLWHSPLFCLLCAFKMYGTANSHLMYTWVLFGENCGYQNRF